MIPPQLTHYPLKSALAKHFWNDSSAYLEGKRAFVEDATDSADLDAQQTHDR